MDKEIKAEFAEMRRQFDKVERWFELGQSQYVDLRAEMQRGFSDMSGELSAMKEDVAVVKQELGLVKQDLSGLRQELHRFRDWTAGQVSDLRASILQLTRRFDATM